MSIDDWRSQIKRGTLEFCILLMISQKPRYGYEIINKLEGWSILAAKESTVYPLLRRLQNEAYLCATWQDSAQGLPPRKYYALTSTGQQYVEQLSQAWEMLQDAIANMKEGIS